MVTLMAGPAGVYQPGQEVEVDPRIASALAEAGYAVEVMAVRAPERAAAPHPVPRVALESDSGGETVEFGGDLVELVGERVALALSQGGIQSLEQARERLEAGDDLARIRGVGKATVAKILEA